MAQGKDINEADLFTSENWSTVLAAVDATYANLVEHQMRLEQQNAELESVRGLLQSILGSVNDVMVVLDRDYRITDCSHSLVTVLAREDIALMGAAFVDMIHDEDRERMLEALARLRLGQDRARLELWLDVAQGAEPYEFSVSARKDTRGRMIGAVVLGRSLGELRRAYGELEAGHEALKQTQAQLVRNEKLAGLGRLLAGVAHELNNPISFVYANAHALERYIGRFESYFAEVERGVPRERLVALREELRLDRALKNLRTAIDGAKDGSERVRDIVDDLRRLSSDGSGEGETFDLVEVAQVAARWVERGSKSEISPQFEGDASLLVTGNPGHIQQVVMNLVQNAMDAMDAMREVEAPTLSLTVTREADRAVLTVADNGPGVRDTAVQSIFDPFFTTKPVGQGTGLGLAISLKIAEEHGGSLALVPTDVGATFRLELPIGDSA